VGLLCNAACFVQRAMQRYQVGGDGAGRGGPVHATPAVPLRVTVDPAGDWRACTDTLPKGCKVMGTVSVGMNTGALVRLADSGNLVMVMAGAISMLNQRQVRMLLEAAERTASETEMLPASLWRDNKEA
jgi:hypothetical protein